jgi:hypothetical protein
MTRNYVAPVDEGGLRSERGGDGAEEDAAGYGNASGDRS